MKQPQRFNTINLRVWRHQTGVQVIQGITGVIEYPLAIHRPIEEFEEIEQSTRSRFSGTWNITHIPTGKSFGISTKVWEDIVHYVENIKDEPALLMLTDETMQSHPEFKQLSNKHAQLRREIMMR